MHGNETHFGVIQCPIGFGVCLNIMLHFSDMGIPCLEYLHKFSFKLAL